MKLNSKEYWDQRFATGDWDAKGGRMQTAMFARAQLAYMPHLGADFSLLDFGCGLGDAMPVYRDAYPHASLFGVDHSSSAVACAQERFGHLCSFACSIEELNGPFDAVVCSNVLEHVEEPLELARYLLSHTRRKLFVVTPYREQPLDAEHLHVFDEGSFQSLGPSTVIVFKSPGWTEYGASLLFHVHGKNFLRRIRGRPLHRRRMQIMYVFDAPAGS